MYLKSFSYFPPCLPESEEEKKKVLCSRAIKEVRIFALGPDGTNISQVSSQWARRMGISFKTRIILCSTPEACLREARRVSEEGVLAVFWTCAVYAKENEFFFSNPDVLPFFFIEIMNLDEMQLAARKEGDISKVASHPSPFPLVADMGCQIVLVDSNSAAAKLCKLGEVDACVTTEKARKIYGLVKLHSFGSPPMVFFGGITSRGAKTIKGIDLRLSS